MALFCIVFCFAVLNCMYGCSASILPAHISTVVISSENEGTCPSQEVLRARLNATKEEIEQVIRDTITPILDRNDFQPPCLCSPTGQWSRIAYLNVSDPEQECPPNWNLRTTTIRGCGRSSPGPACDSAIFPSNGRAYSHVCGRVIAYQLGSPDAFHPSTYSNPSLDEVYIDGVSLTHGAAGSRQHIWSFAAALYENRSPFNPAYVCACINNEQNWPFQTPAFVGNNYFCDTGNPGPRWRDYIGLHSDDPLWDGEGCGPTNTCCQFNNPPWFCTTLPQPTTDDIELRICSDQDLQENVFINLVDIYTS